MGNKVDNLEYLSHKVQHSKVLPLIRFKTYEEIHNIIQKVKYNFKDNIIIRSSSYYEDSKNSSYAGCFESILNVNIHDDITIKHAIKKVLNSLIPAHKNDEIFIQPMLKDVQISGVVFTADLNTLAPYYIINFEYTHKTDTVTAGISKHSQTYIHYKDSPINANSLFIEKLLVSIREIEKVFKSTTLDIEFAYNGEDIYIFQIRHISQINADSIRFFNIEDSLFKLHKKFKKLSGKHPTLLGKKTMFGVMPDWNPAEIIGKKPKPLSFSLYKELVTDDIWAHQRYTYGYRDVRSHPLLISLLGVAYIDIRVSLNSFIPQDLDEATAYKLVDYYLEQLSLNPHNHDKIEFEIVFSCLDFSVENRINILKQHNFKENEIQKIKNSLLLLTNKIFGLYQQDIQKIKQLDAKYIQVESSSLATVDKIYSLNKLCKQYGTLPFAGIARSAFIAISFLKSFVEEKILSQDEYSRFLSSLYTVSKQLNHDLHHLPTEEFLKIYGHLRPGTYDILSQRYDEAYDKYFSKKSNPIKKSSFTFSTKQLSLINHKLAEASLNINAEELISFITQSIESREDAKFSFTKVLSKILQLIQDYGKRLDIPREDLAYLDYKEVLSLYASLDSKDIKESFEKHINENKKFYELTKVIKLPDLLKNENDIYTYSLLENCANYISLSEVEAELLIESEFNTASLQGKIVAIASADPGYDFIFTKGVVGLITCYGGANSHMAIRCAELNLPAVIGIGEHTFQRIQQSSMIKIDCKSQSLKIIS